jgi:hypothetical protein
MRGMNSAVGGRENHRHAHYRFGSLGQVKRSARGVLSHRVMMRTMSSGFPTTAASDVNDTSFEMDKMVAERYKVVRRRAARCSVAGICRLACRRQAQ